IITVKTNKGYQTVIVLLIFTLARAEVQGSITPECKQFLYMGTPPRGLEEQPLKKISQFYAGKPRFVTLYDSFTHIPVYSAYTFKRSDGTKKADVPWMYESQLSVVSGSREMEPLHSVNAPRSFEDSQAVLDDYSNTVIYERGQLNPDEHQAHPDDKAATYTLTNVVPRVRVQHRPMERLRAHHPPEAEQLLPWDCLRGHRGHHLSSHYSPPQHEPFGYNHSKVLSRSASHKISYEESVLIII
uniref:Zgc:172339 n=1 Tax=Nothobranchius furzeri TaxID=105023 RepID=A0A8C6VWN9_NOTFU